ncbi:ty3-gypsy retrotransposon protein [Tanacetum coccineum]
MPILSKSLSLSNPLFFLLTYLSSFVPFIYCNCTGCIIGAFIEPTHHGRSTVERHSKALDKSFTLYTDLQKSLSDITHQLTRLEKQPLHQPPPTPPPLLPNPNSTLQPRLPKLEIPPFSGSNTLGWLFQIERFFAFHRTPDAQKLDVASFYMTGDALQWYSWMHSKSQLSTWDKFASDLALRFGSSSFGLSTANLLNCFLSGLREDIRRELFLLKPATLHEAIGMAKLVEDKLTTSRFSNPRSPTVRPFNNPSTQPPLVTRNNPLPIKRFSSTEMAARQEKGLCFNCDDFFSPGHRCKSKQFLYLLVEEQLSEEQAYPYANEATEPTAPILAAPSSPRLDEPVIYPSPTDTLPAISLHAFTGQFVPRTLKVAVLIFTVGNGDTVGSVGLTPQQQINLGHTPFVMDLFLLPIYGADIVLGVEWLATLGPIVFDYKNLYMEINHNGTLVHFPGLVHPTFSQISFSQLQKAETQDAVVSFFHLQVVESPETTSSPLVHPTPTPILDAALKQLMVKYATIFSVPKSLPPTRPFDHRIPLLPNTSPINVKPYCYPHFQKAEMERLISEMLSKEIIRPSNNPFSLPVLLVKKKDGTWRFCVDYRAVNAVTIKDRFLIPTVDELLDELHGGTIFSKLDLQAGYHQLLIQEEDIAKTAFRTHHGHYEFLVMPFGLSNTPSTFQATMNHIFRSVLRKFVLVFFDYILVYSTSWELHLQHLETVFSILQSNLFFANQSKCEFGSSSISYIGHTVSSKGVSIDPLKVKAIKDWPLPKNIKQLCGFLRLAGYYRRFAAHYASLAAPLTQLLRKDAFVWSDSATTVFNNLKHALMHTPVLTLPDFSKAFIIQTNASGSGIGAILSQGGHPIAYFSKQMSPQLQQALTYVREMFAITEAVKHWKQYLLGRPIHIETDLQSLRLGSENGPADTPSRVPQGSLNTLQAVSTPVCNVLTALRKFLAHHTKSLALIQAIANLPDDYPHHEFREGLIFYKNQILVPSDSALQQLLLAGYHNTLVGGHAGMQCTLARISSTFCWPNMKVTIRSFVSQCQVCQEIKPFNKAPQGLLRPLPILGKIWDCISLDFITHLSVCGGKTTVLVVVDRLSKHGHFCPLGQHFTAPHVQSSFWKELFKLQGTTLSMSTAYHPQSDGQTEVLNRCLEDYLRCFASDNPRTWLQYLPWAEWCYNTSWHSTIKMTPFEAVYGRSPPSLLDYIAGTSNVDAVDALLQSRTELISQLQSNISRAQLRMCNQANAHRTDVEFQVDDWVFVKLQPYRQSSVALRHSQKLSKRFFGLFRIVERIGPVAYRLDLPEESQIHNVFHISVLKKCNGDPLTQQQPLPPYSIGSHPILTPTEVLGYRKVLVHNRQIPQVLIRWQQQDPSEATWESLDDFRKDFPSFNLEDKVLLDAGGNDASQIIKEHKLKNQVKRKSTRETRVPAKLRE